MEGQVPGSVTLGEGQAAIVFAAMCGGVAYDIGDDLPTLGTEPERLTLVTNPSVLQMAKLGHVAKPLDLMTYRPEDEQPSIFLLREDQRQSMLAVFNWTEQPKSHAFTLSDLGLPTGHAYHLYDALNGDKSMAFGEEAIHVDGQTAHSVKLIKIIDDSQSPAPPTITAQAPTSAKVREDVRFSVRAADDGVPALAYHWDFGDGVSSEGADQTHTYTLAGAYTVRLTVNGVDGVSVQKRFAITVDGLMEIGQPRRYAEAAPEPGSINE